MKNLGYKSWTVNSNPQYIKSQGRICVFLGHPNDVIDVESNEGSQIHVYDNDNLIFSGSKQEFFEKLKK